MWSFWLIVAGIFFIIEMATVGFLMFWLGIGALLAMITSFLTSSIVIQTIVFVVISGILIPYFTTRLMSIVVSFSVVLTFIPLFEFFLTN